MPTIEQIRAARALLDWSQSDLAEKADLSQTGIARIENGTNRPNSQTLEKIKRAFDDADIEFIDETGVKRRPEGHVQTYRGHEGFVAFLVDVYETLKQPNAFKEVVVNNVSEDQFIKWERDYLEMHQKRMREVGAKYKIVIEEGDHNFTANEYARYKWIPKTTFSSISFYVYGTKSALIHFTDDDVNVYVINSRAIAHFYRNEFDKVWALAAEPKKLANVANR